MHKNRIKLIAIILFAVPFILLAIFKDTPTTSAAIIDGDVAAEYKAKCMACHTPKATKFYDPAKSDEELVRAILSGKKGEKPPFMPAFGTKGMTEDQAKAMLEYMKALRAPKE